MAQSTRRKLDIANDALVMINERPLKSLQGALGIRVNSAIRQALFEIDTMQDWSWLRREQNAFTWTNEFASVSEAFQRVVDVKWEPSNGNGRRIPLRFLPKDEFDYIEKVAYDSNNQQRPHFYTISKDKEIGITPYPTDFTEQSKIYFYFIGWTPLPPSETSFFNMPEEFLELVTVRSAAILALTHLGDSGMSGTLAQSYEAQVQRLRDRDRGVPTEGNNMFRPRRV